MSALFLYSFGLGTYIDPTPGELYNGVNPMRKKDSIITEKQGLR